MYGTVRDWEVTYGGKWSRLDELHGQNECAVEPIQRVG